MVNDCDLNFCFPLAGLIEMPGTTLRPSAPRQKKMRSSNKPPASPIVSQLVEMGFPRKSVEIAEKALCKILTIYTIFHYRSMIKNENEICTILIPEGNSYCRRERSARGPRFKVSSERLYQQKLTFHNGHPSKYRPGSMLLNPSALGG